jgi:hypothetical protein
MSNKGKPSPIGRPALIGRPEPVRILEEIRQCLTGRMWDSDTANNIADILTRNGYVIEEPVEDSEN